MEDSLKKRYVIKLFANLIAGVVNAAVIAVVPKALGPLAYGQFTFLQQFFAQVIAFFDAGTSTAFFTKLSAQKNKEELMTYYFFYSLALLLMLFLIVFICDVFEMEGKVIEGIPAFYLYLGLLFGFLVWLTQVYVKISDAYALTVSVEILKVAHKIFVLLVLLVLVFRYRLDLEMYFYFNYFALTSFLVLITFLFIKKGVFSRALCGLNVDFKGVSMGFYRYASPIFIFNIVGISVGIFDLWLLQRVSGSVEVGFYGLAFSIAAMCSLFTTAMTPIITREFSKLYAEDDLSKMNALFKRYVPMLFSVSAFFGVFIAFQSENVIYIFTDLRFEEALPALIIMSLYPLHQTYGQLTSSVFFASGKTVMYRNIGLVTSLLGLIFSGILIFHLELGAMGFALKMVLIQLIGVNVQLFFNVKLLKLRVCVFFRHQILAILFFSSIAFLAKSITMFDVSPLHEFLLSGSLYSFISFVGFLIFPDVLKITRPELAHAYRKFKLSFSKVLS